MKTNIKMRVTPEQSTKIQEICFDNGVKWKIALNKISHIDEPYLAIEPTRIFYKSTEVDYSNIPSLFKEIDADLFIRTNGTCEENQAKRLLEKLENMEDVEIYTAKEFNNISLKLKKKNEILKKARIKRKNQREELHKLNLKLQKCISLKEYTNVITVKNNVIKELENENYLNKGRLHLSSLNNVAQQKEIEKLKAVIEYLESKVK